MNRPGLSGEFFVQHLCWFFKFDLLLFVECVLHRPPRKTARRREGFCTPMWVTFERQSHPQRGHFFIPNHTEGAAEPGDPGVHGGTCPDRRVPSLQATAAPRSPEAMVRFDNFRAATEPKETRKRSTS